MMLVVSAIARTSLEEQLPTIGNLIFIVNFVIQSGILTIEAIPIARTSFLYAFSYS
ncbi:hypothetical protein [Chroococcidiopsis sp. SAG 2025]|uniref:hypothetical protein n=1 Tax=Chroococcidiopsis sp. SAG 2025 TaxID=171389 RepID=UPI00293733BF|nr:hypothetical protein [Chroococcidiopsis sp. SAG 2025]